VELAAHRPQATSDVAQPLAVSQLSESHRQKLVPTRETLLLVIATVAQHAFQELIPWEMIDELGENSLAKIHPSLSEICAGTPRGQPEASSGEKQFKSQNLHPRLNCRAINRLHEMEKSSPGQQ
jgi:hypothetical protein